MEQRTNEAVVQGAGGARLKKGGKKPLVIIGIIAAVLLAAYLGLCAYAGSRNTFFPNFAVHGIDVGGMDTAGAANALAAELPGQTIELQIMEVPEAEGWPSEPLPTVTLGQLGYTADRCGAIAERLLAKQRGAGFLTRGWRFISALVSLSDGGISADDRDQAAFEDGVAKLAGDLSLEPQDTAYAVGENKLLITKAVNGRSIQESALAEALDHAILQYGARGGLEAPISFAKFNANTLTAQEIHDEVSGEVKNAGYDAETDSIIPERMGAEFDVAAAQAALDAAGPGETVTVEARIEYPEVTAAELKEVLFRDVLGEARTKVGGTAARKSNVDLSAATINNYVMNTGDIFSYNGVVGQRTAARGYKPAPAYVKGETVDEIGGGICQTSSTLYLACLRANLEITERYAHRYIPSYITAGLDATVSWGGPDYKFTNDTSYPIKIVTEYTGGYLTVKVLGTKTDDVTVKMTNEFLSSTPFEVVYEDDPTLAPGTEQVKTTPYTGYKYRTYRNLYDGNGKLISSFYEATSDYKARNKVILRGPAKEAEPTAPVAGPGEIPVMPEEPDTPIEEPVEEPVQTPIIVLPGEFPEPAA